MPLPRADETRFVADQTVVILETELPVEYKGFYVLIVPDAAAGKKDRFSVYKIPSSPSRRTKILGRELTLSQARKVAESAGTWTLVKGTK